MAIGILLPFQLGGLVMATPMLRSLRRHFGTSTRLVGIVRPRLTHVLEGTPWLDDQWTFVPKAGQSETHDSSLVSRMRREGVETVVFLARSFRATVLAWLGGAKRRVGYVRHGRGTLLTQKLDWPHLQGRSHAYSMVDHYLRLAEAIGCPPGTTEMELATVERDEQSADLVWQRLGLRSDGRVFLIHAAGSQGSAGHWPTEHFGDLARRVACELDHDVLVLCGPKQRQTARDIVRRADHARVFSMAEQPLDLGTRKACIRRGGGMVSNDSDERFIAAAFGKPVVTLFGPTLPDWNELPAAQLTNVYLHLDCIGCQNRVCPLRHHKCMFDLSVDVVYGEVARILEESRAACAA